MQVSVPLTQMSDQNSLEFTLKLSTRRRTIGLQVTAAGELVVAAPVGTQPETIRQALAKHRDWIVRKLAERREALSRLQPGEAYYLGQAYPVRLVDHTLHPVGLTEGEMRLRRAGGAVQAWGLLQQWYRQEAARLLTDRVEHFARLLKLKAGAIEIRPWRRRWGECRPQNGLLRFNWRLVLLPSAILDYVAAHEVTHLAVPGHPPRFWQRLARVMPDWAERRWWLNRYGSPFLLWELELP
jgi:predicted metal-dependent hydrolase